MAREPLFEDLREQVRSVICGLDCVFVQPRAKMTTVVPWVRTQNRLNLQTEKKHSVRACTASTKTEDTIRPRSDCRKRSVGHSRETRNSSKLKTRCFRKRAKNPQNSPKKPNPVRSAGIAILQLLQSVDPSTSLPSRSKASG